MQLHKCGTLPAPAVWCKPGVNSLVTEKSCYRVRPGCLGPVGLEEEEVEVEVEVEVELAVELKPGAAGTC